MGIQKDAGELLAFIYKEKVEGNEVPSIRNITDTTKWDRDRVLNALQYLQGKNLINGQTIKTLGSSKPQFATVDDISPYGIDVLENEQEFNRTFNFSINLLFLKFSWGAEEA